MIQLYANTTPNEAAPLSQLASSSGMTGERLTNNDSATSEGALSNNLGAADAVAAAKTVIQRIPTICET